ncbi:MAG: hypothetical protein EHM84_00850 [Lysobacterales bacterium]|nr:MAG: hypothetical protein EHM84_00850 [Xanthomonadales bacterium]
MTRDAALVWIRAHETDSNEQAAQALLALLDEETRALQERHRGQIDRLREENAKLRGRPAAVLDYVRAELDQDELETAMGALEAENARLRAFVTEAHGMIDELTDAVRGLGDK